MALDTGVPLTKEERLSTKCQPSNGDLVNAVDTLRSDRQCTFVRTDNARSSVNVKQLQLYYKK